MALKEPIPALRSLLATSDSRLLWALWRAFGACAGITSLRPYFGRFLLSFTPPLTVIQPLTGVRP